MKRSAVRTTPARTFNCKKCGARLEIPEAPSNETIISCTACGTQLGTWVEVKHEMKELARGPREKQKVRDAMAER